MLVWYLVVQLSSGLLPPQPQTGTFIYQNMPRIDVTLIYIVTETFDSPIIVSKNRQLPEWTLLLYQLHWQILWIACITALLCPLLVLWAPILPICCCATWNLDLVALLATTTKNINLDITLNGKNIFAKLLNLRFIYIVLSHPWKWNSATLEERYNDTNAYFMLKVKPTRFCP